MIVSASRALCTLAIRRHVRAIDDLDPWLLASALTCFFHSTRQAHPKRIRRELQREPDIG